MSPTQRTLAHLREAGYLAEVVERWNPHARVRHDLFGCLDILAIGPDIVGVQATSGSNTASRVKKLEQSSALPVLKAAGVRVVVHGWRKLGGRWSVREVTL
jgi:hypothetical protein